METKLMSFSTYKETQKLKVINICWEKNTDLVIADPRKGASEFLESPSWRPIVGLVFSVRKIEVHNEGMQSSALTNDTP